MLNIILAEDNKVDQVATIEYLKSNFTEVNVSTVSSCKTLLELLDQNLDCDIIILDHILEDEQSLKYIDKIKAKANLAEIIVLSGQSDIAVCIQYLNSGVFAYLNKENNSFKNLVKNINEILAKKKGTFSMMAINKYAVFLILFGILLGLGLFYFFSKA